MGVWGDQVSVEIHGDGLLAEIMKASQGATSDVRNAA
jgi:hypothetical protein